MRIAALDLGTNTCLCLIANIDVSGPAPEIKKVVRDEVRVVRLGQGVQASRELHLEALARAEQTFKEFSAFIAEAKCDRVLAVATSAARDVTNGQKLIALGKKYGIPIEIISGEKEAELTFAGAFEPLNPATTSGATSGMTAMIDVGGGSTEIIFGNAKGVFLRFSADVGSVRLTELFVKAHPIAEAQILQLQEHVRLLINQNFDLALEKWNETAQLNAIRGTVPLPPVLKDELIGKVEQVIAVAGTPTTLAAVDLGHAFESEKVHGHVFTLVKLDEWTARLSAMSVGERQKLAGMEPKRADVIVAGAICLTEAMRAIDAPRIQVSIRGLRYGVAKWCAAR